MCEILLRPDQDQSCSAQILDQILADTDRFHHYIVVRCSKNAITVFFGSERSKKIHRYTLKIHLIVRELLKIAFFGVRKFIQIFTFFVIVRSIFIREG